MRKIEKDNLHAERRKGIQYVKDNQCRECEEFCFTFVGGWMRDLCECFSMRYDGFICEPEKKLRGKNGNN